MQLSQWLVVMKCPKCNSPLIWGGDHSYEDYGLEGEGIVSNHTCYNTSCTVETVLLYDNLNKLQPWQEEVLAREGLTDKDPFFDHFDHHPASAKKHKEK